MTIRILLNFALLLSTSISITTAADTENLVATGNKAIVSTGHPIATDVAIGVLREGGNAVDAAVAAALTLGVVKSSGSGLGGGCFIVDGKMNQRL